MGGLGLAYARSNEQAKAERLRDELLDRSAREYISPVGMFEIFIGLGDRESAYRQIDAIFEDGATGWGLEIIYGPYLNELWPEARFADRFHRLRLVQG